MKSFLAAQDCFRYLLPHRAPTDRQLIYFPYWRFKGMLFSCLSGGIDHRFLDASQQAVSTPLFPTSLGLRSQALKLRFVSPDTTGWFIRPSRSIRQAMDPLIRRTHRDLVGSVLYQTHVGESLSLIYAPFYRDRHALVDAVLNRPVSPEGGDDVDWGQFAGGKASLGIRFIPTLCPNCGWDMQGRRDALVLHCTNCESMWQASRKGLQRVNVAHMAGGDAGSIFLPFWRIRARVDGLTLTSLADLVKLANLPRLIQSEWEQAPCHFWCPAFKVRPRSFLRLIHQVTLAQPRDNMVPRVPNGDMHPVNLPISEAVETVKLNLAGFMQPRRAVEANLASLTIKPHRYLLIYLPFDVGHHDLVQSRWRIAINRNQLALAGNL